MVTLGTASSRSCPQCAQTILPFPTSCGQAIGISTRSAMAQRKLFNVTGGISPATLRPSTTLPAQNRAANVRRVYGWVIQLRKGIERVSGINKAGSTGGEKSFDPTDRARLLWKAASPELRRHGTVIRFVVVVMAYAMALTRQFRNLKLISTIIPLSL